MGMVNNPRNPRNRFTPERLTAARNIAGLRKNDLARAVGVSATAISQWENGQRKPDRETIFKLATCLNIPARFFSRDAAPTDLQASNAHFRSLRNTSQMTRNRAATYAYLVADVVTELEQLLVLPEVDVPKYPLIPTVRQPGMPEIAAQTLRKHWNLGMGPIPNVIRCVEAAGVVIVFGPSDLAGVDAFSTVESPRPIIVLNPCKDDYYRQRFDVAHELGHLVMHPDAEPGNKEAEMQANRFASEFLVPAKSVRGRLPSRMGGKDWASLWSLKEEWGVSVQALLYRARDCGALSPTSYRNAMITLSKRGQKIKEPGAIRKREETSLLPTAIEILSSEGYPVEEIADWTDLPLGRVLQIVSKTGEPPNEQQMQVRAPVIHLQSKRPPE